MSIGRRDPVEVDALVRAIPASDVAKLASDTKLGMDLGDDFVVQVQVLPFGDARQAQSTEIVDSLESFLVHPIAQAVDHIFYNAEPVVHGRRADLDRSATEQDELRRVFPSGDTTDTGD